MPVNLDFSYLLQNDDGSLLTVADKDCPFQPNGTVNFEIDADNADRFQLLPPLQFPREICEGSIIYAPRISLKRRLSASEGNISFFLIAKVGFIISIHTFNTFDIIVSIKFLVSKIAGDWNENQLLNCK